MVWFFVGTAIAAFGFWFIGQGALALAAENKRKFLFQEAKTVEYIATTCGCLLLLCLAALIIGGLVVAGRAVL